MLGEIQKPEAEPAEGSSSQAKASRRCQIIIAVTKLFRYPCGDGHLHISTKNIPLPESSNHYGDGKRLIYTAHSKESQVYLYAMSILCGVDGPYGSPSNPPINTLS